MYDLLIMSSRDGTLLSAGFIFPLAPAGTARAGGAGDGGAGVANLTEALLPFEMSPVASRLFFSCNDSPANGYAGGPSHGVSSVRRCDTEAARLGSRWPRSTSSGGSPENWIAAPGS